MKYNYLARTQKGEIQTGAIEAPSESAAIETLQSHNLVVVAIELLEKKAFLSMNLKIFGRVSKKEVVIFCRQLSILVGSEVPVVQSLKSLAAQTSNRTFKEIIDHIASDVEGGTLLSKSFEKYPKVFSNFYVNLIRAGEAAGRLQASLEFLAEHLEKEYYLISKVQRAMYYPGFVLGAFVLIFIGMMIWVVPELTDFLEGFGVELPLITRIIIGISNFCVSFSWLIGLVAVGGGLGFWYFIKIPVGREIFDRIKLRLPILGNVLRQTYLAHFTKNLSTLIKGGLPIIQALEISGSVINNKVFQKIISKARDEVSRGSSISSVFEKETLIPPVVSQMIKTGEKTGRLDYILENLANFYTREVDNIVDNLSSLIEPILIVCLGAMVAVLMSAILLPIYSMSQSIGD